MKTNEQNPPEDEGTPFNMAMLYYISLRKLIDKKNEAKIMGNIQGWYDGLQAIRDEIDFVITKGIHCEKCKKKIDNVDDSWLDDQFAQVSNYMDTPIRRQQSLANQLQAMIANDVPPVLREIDRKLMLIMNKNHMIFPRIENRGGIDKLAAAYKLGIQQPGQQR